MNDLQAINDIVVESIKSSSYISALISSGVFISYTLINKTIDYFKSKNKNKPIIEMAIAIKEISSNIVKLNSVLDKTLQDSEKKQLNYCKVAIDLSFKDFQNRILKECNDIIIKNNIQKNKKLITDNIHKLVSTSYYSLYAILSDYEINNATIATRLQPIWIENVYNDVVDIIFNGQEAIVRISQLESRLSILVTEYSTYVNNKTFNH